MKNYLKVMIAMIVFIVIIAMGVLYVDSTEKKSEKTTAPNGVSVELIKMDRSTYKGEDKKYELYTCEIKLTNEKDQVETLGGIDFELAGKNGKTLMVASDFESFVTELKPNEKDIIKKLFFKVSKKYQPDYLIYHYSINDSVKITLK